LNSVQVAAAKTPRYNDLDERYRDNFPTHSSAPKSYLPFENERLAKHVLVRDKKAKKTNFRTTLATPSPTLADDWGHRVNSVEEDGDYWPPPSETYYRGSRKVATRRPATTRRPTTTATTTTTTTRRTTTTTQRPRTWGPTLAPYLNSFYTDDSDSPFAVVPPEATPRSLLQSVADLTGDRGPAPPALPPVRPSPTPRRRPTPRLPNGFSYDDYFAYGVGEVNPSPTRRPPSLSFASPRPTPHQPFQPRRLASNALHPIESAAVTVRPYGRPKPTTAPVWTEPRYRDASTRFKASPTVRSEVYSRPPSASVGTFGRKNEGKVARKDGGANGRGRKRKLQALLQQKRLQEALIADNLGPSRAARPLGKKSKKQRERPYQEVRQLPQRPETLRDQLRALRRAKRRKAMALQEYHRANQHHQQLNYQGNFFAEPTFPSFSGFAAGLGG